MSGSYFYNVTLQDTTHGMISSTNFSMMLTRDHIEDAAKSRSRMSLSATDEFWLVPIEEAAPDECTNDYNENIPMPPSHHQLLSDNLVTFATLKGHDHTSAHNINNNIDGYNVCRKTISSVKQQGGGSWLLGFTRLNDRMVPEEDDLPGLICDDSSSTYCSDESSDVESISSFSSRDTVSKPKKKVVSFATNAKVQPIPHSSTLTSQQRRKMYSTSFEVRQNKQRNKMEYRYDRCDWRNATEEWEMGVDMVTGEPIHPVHDQF